MFKRYVHFADIIHTRAAILGIRSTRGDIVLYWILRAQFNCSISTLNLESNLFLRRQFLYIVELPSDSTAFDFIRILMLRTSATALWTILSVLHFKSHCNQEMHDMNISFGMSKALVSWKPINIFRKWIELFINILFSFVEHTVLNLNCTKTSWAQSFRFLSQFYLKTCTFVMQFSVGTGFCHLLPMPRRSSLKIRSFWGIMAQYFLSFEIRNVGIPKFAIIYFVKMKYFLVFLVAFALYSPSESLNLKNIGKSAVDVVKGVVEKIPDAIPSTETLLQSSKNLIVGYPFEKVARFIFMNLSNNSLHSQVMLLTPVHFYRFIRPSTCCVSEISLRMLCVQLCSLVFTCTFE